MGGIFGGIVTAMEAMAPATMMLRLGPVIGLPASLVGRGLPVIPGGGGVPFERLVV
jgi:hypothetical protein